MTFLRCVSFGVDSRADEMFGAQEPEMEVSGRSEKVPLSYFDPVRLELFVFEEERATYDVRVDLRVCDVEDEVKLKGGPG